MRKKIWMLWDDRSTAQPAVVGLAIDLWKTLNPTWEFELCNGERLRRSMQSIGTVAEQLPIQAQSDLFRLKLLYEQGGLWVDATCIPLRPLDTWLEEASGFGFFAFSFENEKPRNIASWFIYGDKEGRLVELWLDAAIKYWDTARVLLRPPMGPRMAYIDQNWREFMGRYARDVLRVYPYFWAHYLFQELVRDNPEARVLWEAVKRLDAEPCLAITGLLIRTAPNKKQTPRLFEEILAIGKRSEAPVLKVLWQRELPCEKLRRIVLERNRA